MERGDTQRGYTHVKETTQGRDYTERGKGKHRERRLHGKRTTRRRKRGHTKGRDIHGEPGTNTERKQYRKGITRRRERDIHGEETI